MNSNRLFVLFSLVVLAGVSYAVYRWVQPEPAPAARSAAKRSTTTTVRAAGDKGPARTAKNLHLSRKDDVGTDVEEKDLVKQSKPIAELDAKFATWREDGKKAVEDMFGGDRQKIGDAFRLAMQNDEFRTNFGRMRELEAQYRTATDDKKQAIMDELATVRTRGLGMLKQAGAGAAPAAANQGPTITITGPNGAPATNGADAPAAAPAPAPAAPIVFQ